MPRIAWGAIDDAFRFESTEQIDLAKEVGLRIWVHTGAGRSEVLLQFHHACCDGTGAYRFIGDLLAEYGIQTAFENPPVVEPFDTYRLKGRLARMAAKGTGRSGFAQAKDALRHARSVFFQRIAPLAKPTDAVTASDPPVAYPGIVTRIFTKSDYKALRKVAGSAGAMFNDLLLAEMFRTIRDWNEKHGQRSSRRIRIMMPTDLRDKEDITMPAANMTAYSFITRSCEDCDDRLGLLHGLRDETLAIKRNQPGRNFADAVMNSRYVPGLLKFLLNRKQCLATVILSNVGDPSRRFLARFPRESGKIRCGNLLLERISGVPPLRPLSRATVSIVTYGQEFAVNFRCDPKSFSPAASNELLDLFVARLAEYDCHALQESQQGVLGAIAKTVD